MVILQGIFEEFLYYSNSHLMGLLYRSLHHLEVGIKPVWVFDGKPPDMKKEEISARVKAKSTAQEKFMVAEQEGDVEEEVKMAKRSIQVTPQMIENSKSLLKIFGFPVIQAKSEAEAQCAALNRAGKVFAVGSEDLDTLAYSAPMMLRRVKGKKDVIFEIQHSVVLQELGLSKEQFVDLCILCGSDYTDGIKGIGPATAYKFIKSNGNLEKALEAIKNTTSKTKGTNRYQVPESFDYTEVRKIFNNPDVFNPAEIQVFLLYIN
jgi:flap endonuclease-1